MPCWIKQWLMIATAKHNKELYGRIELNGANLRYPYLLPKEE
jgi:hypothetical protein